MLFYGSDIGSRMIEAMKLLRDRHAMHATDETMVDFVEQFYDSLVFVSHWSH